MRLPPPPPPGAPCTLRNPPITSRPLDPKPQDPQPQRHATPTTLQPAPVRCQASRSGFGVQGQRLHGNCTRLKVAVDLAVAELLDGEGDALAVGNALWSRLHVHHLDLVVLRPDDLEEGVSVKERERKSVRGTLRRSLHD